MNTTTITIKEDLKDKLDEHRHPAQAYHGFLQELLENWRKKHEEQ